MPSGNHQKFQKVQLSVSFVKNSFSACTIRFWSAYEGTSQVHNAAPAPPKLALFFRSTRMPICVITTCVTGTYRYSGAKGIGFVLQNRPGQGQGSDGRRPGEEQYSLGPASPVPTGGELALFCTVVPWQGLPPHLASRHPFLLAFGKLALFFQDHRKSKMCHNCFSKNHLPWFSLGENWLCFPEYGSAALGSATLIAPPGRGVARKLALFRTAGLE